VQFGEGYFMVIEGSDCFRKCCFSEFVHLCNISIRNMLLSYSIFPAYRQAGLAVIGPKGLSAGLPKHYYIAK
jgi:hypothetical protein